jgi:hypothetical protein
MGSPPVSSGRESYGIVIPLKRGDSVSAPVTSPAPAFVSLADIVASSRGSSTDETPAASAGFLGVTFESIHGESSDYSCVVLGTSAGSNTSSSSNTNNNRLRSGSNNSEGGVLLYENAAAFPSSRAHKPGDVMHRTGSNTSEVGAPMYANDAAIQNSRAVKTGEAMYSVAFHMDSAHRVPAHSSGDVIVGDGNYSHISSSSVAAATAAATRLRDSSVYSQAVHSAGAETTPLYEEPVHKNSGATAAAAMPVSPPAVPPPRHASVSTRPSAAPAKKSPLELALEARMREIEDKVGVCANEEVVLTCCCCFCVRSKGQRR